MRGGGGGKFLKGELKVSRKSRCKEVFFDKQKTADEVESRDWSSDVCSSNIKGQKHMFKVDKPLQMSIPLSRIQSN